ncbi:MAG: Glycosyl transferase, family 2 [Candidatus Shapirobacteria bacterium GW2011_GWE1_38_10]|uniref:Glycosyl transferase, family 2 n=1 Tax=Candidatus Shapirobacteria bacterium GW2011_GWE1_38_10 TaxID=1618488 RepID=A0A0G0KJG5_9BACT|nr:MAG: Glycosyl transferase, family 2 [Candidatus Shapirobacteria bacterium GW2011_GWF2_37_20]KKQ49344.1 MAG: Glycosyl transferase, family 2 [Candidatus Shapirobacteria bacterium GW2011_GWE1_38_10]KKQ65087.1 MAG: Glycosyl transferase, family 2 [Candidatus Shapirobacteria bacterium GW2011_GWF1_38_23]HBP51349.1 glycosyltransferase [Candidatus Shapirobacteria bacterium]
MSKHFPKISIVTPSYNQGQFLEKTILSVLQQKYPNLEYIIIDGKSTDSSLQIIKKYQKHLTFWQSKKDSGQANALNIGFKHATGDILCWLNSDDILLPHSLALVSKLFSQYPHLDWLTSQSTIINKDDEIIQSGLHFGKVPLFLRLGLYHGKCLGFIPQEGTFWRQSLWKKSEAKIPNRHYCLDFELWRRFAKYSPLVTLEAPLASFRHHSQQKTSAMKKYYQEIHPLLPYIPRFVGIIGRIINPFLRRLCPRIYFNKLNYQWTYHPGISTYQIK